MIPKRSLFTLAKVLRGIPILGTLEGTPAARAGLRYGDILISVNGVRTTNVAEYVEAKAARTDGMDIVVFRAGEEQARELVYDELVDTDPQKILDELISLRIGNLDEGSDPTGQA